MNRNEDKSITFKRIIKSIVVILVDLAVYLVLGLLMMSYDDFYDESKGEYWGLESMTHFDKAVVFGMYSWHAINLVVICLIVYKFVKALRKRKLPELKDS